MKLALPDVASWSRRERLMAAGGLFILSLLAMDRLVLGPWWNHAIKIRHEIRKLEEGIRTNQELLSRVPIIQAEASAYQEYLESKPEATDMAGLLREIESLGTSSGLSLGEVKPLPMVSNALYDEYALEVRGRGSIEQWVHFIHLVQTSKAMFSVERATLERSSGDPGLLDASTRLTGKVIHDPVAPQPAEEPSA